MATAMKSGGLLTGSNCKILLDNKTIAYATELSYSADVQTIGVEILGKFEVLTYEPVGMSVSGSFTVVRYTKASGTDPERKLDGASANGNGYSQSMGTMKNAFNPALIMSTALVDIQVMQNTIAIDGSAGAPESVMKIRQCRLTRVNGSINKRNVLMETYQFQGVLIDDDTSSSARTVIQTDGT